jgi:hypothetical protein
VYYSSKLQGLDLYFSSVVEIKQINDEKCLAFNFNVKESITRRT